MKRLFGMHSCSYRHDLVLALMILFIGFCVSLTLYATEQKPEKKALNFHEKQSLAISKISDEMVPEVRKFLDACLPMLGLETTPVDGFRGYRGVENREEGIEFSFQVKQVEDFKFSGFLCKGGTLQLVEASNGELILRIAYGDYSYQFNSPVRFPNIDLIVKMKDHPSPLVLSHIVDSSTDDGKAYVLMMEDGEYKMVQNRKTTEEVEQVSRIVLEIDADFGNQAYFGSVKENAAIVEGYFTKYAALMKNNWKPVARDQANLKAPATGMSEVNIVPANTAFAVDLYHKLASRPGNLFFSPYSISSILAMLYAGAAGQTKKQMTAVLHFPENDDDFHIQFTLLQKQLFSGSRSQALEIRLASSLWVDSRFPVKSVYKNMLEKHYGSAAFQADFVNRSTEEMANINNWVAGETADNIKELLGPNDIDPSTVMVLCNAIYFKGDWQSRFDKKLTSDKPFFVTPAKTVQVPMMYQKAEMRYQQFAGFAAIEMPYLDCDWSMFVLLPDNIDGIDKLGADLSAAQLKNWQKTIHAAAPSLTEIRFPKLHFSSSFDMAKVLATMGMPVVFSDRADFSGISDSDDFFVTKVIHQAFLDVNEKGTEAAAATAVTGTRSIEISNNFNADHPFIFFIADNRTGSILFLGKVMNPVAVVSS